MNNFLEIISLADNYYEKCQEYLMLKIAIIKKLPNGKYRVESEKGKNLGTYPSESQAKKRLKQIEFFKHVKRKKKASSDMIDLSHLDDLSYSAIMRELRQYDDYEIVETFLSAYKNCFDKLVFAGIEKPAEKALPITIMMFNQSYKLKLE